MIGTLTRIRQPDVEGENPLRENGITGRFERAPTPGKPFSIANQEPLEDETQHALMPGGGTAKLPAPGPALGRIVTTSPIESIEDTPAGYTFTTWTGSTYELEVHDVA